MGEFISILYRVATHIQQLNIKPKEASDHAVQHVMGFDISS